jgi:hypothetical protein
LNQIDPALSKEYTLERYKNSDKTNQPEPEFKEFKTAPVFRQKINLPSIESLPDEHFAKVYVKSRKIPEQMFSKLFFAEDFKDFVNSFGIEKELHNNDKRLIIPFFDKDKNLIAFQGRSLGESKLRYITIRLHDNIDGVNVANTKLFGTDSINDTERILVVEGPIDSMFLNNSVAVASSNLESITEVYDKNNVVLIFDNEPRNKEIVKLLDRAIDNHFKVCIWPEMIEEKDINDMILSGFSQDELQDIIDNNTFVNLRAKMEFVKWKKC